jgi:hypothetical protein
MHTNEDSTDIDVQKRRRLRVGADDSPVGVVERFDSFHLWNMRSRASVPHQSRRKAKKLARLSCFFHRRPHPPPLAFSAVFLGQKPPCFVNRDGVRLLSENPQNLTGGGVCVCVCVCVCGQCACACVCGGGGEGGGGGGQFCFAICYPRLSSHQQPPSANNPPPHHDCHNDRRVARTNTITVTSIKHGSELSERTCS